MDNIDDWLWSRNYKLVPHPSGGVSIAFLDQLYFFNAGVNVLIDIE